jgi:hypothetical protein
MVLAAVAGAVVGPAPGALEGGGVPPVPALIHLLALPRPAPVRLPPLAC